jgi:uncharacterized OsmC-like protein
LDVVVNGERAMEPPDVWARLEMVYRLRENLEEQAIKQANQLREGRYSSVAAMLRKTAPIVFRYLIAPA